MEKLAFYYLNCENYFEAIIHLNDLIEQFPKSKTYYFWRGLANFKMERYEEAHTDYSSALQLDENKELQFQLYSRLSLCKFFLDDFDGGISDFKRVLK